MPRHRKEGWTRWDEWWNEWRTLVWAASSTGLVVLVVYTWVMWRVLTAS